MMDLITKYRPKTFDGVIGQADIIRSIKSVIKSGISHSFLFTGPSGVGKTTLARIIAGTIGCDPQNIIEIDAATNTGIDDMRGVTQGLKYKSLGRNPSKAIIVDEVHRLSQPAWSSLLKIIEEPPPHVYWMLCTTEEGKIPNTIKTRCLRYGLLPVQSDIIFEYLCTISESENFQTSEEVLSLVAELAEGSVRKALADLATVRACKKRATAAGLIRDASESREVIDLCRYLVRGRALNWQTAMGYIKPIQDMNAESVRIVATSYLTKALINTKDDRQAPILLNLLVAFSGVCNQSDKMAPILIAIGSIIFEEE